MTAMLVSFVLLYGYVDIWFILTISIKSIHVGIYNTNYNFYSLTVMQVVISGKKVTRRIVYLNKSMGEESMQLLQ